ncbi:MAG: sulfatase [Bacteroidales bacterium]|nr:sulfatase [Bacteroidales bacterium]
MKFPLNQLRFLALSLPAVSAAVAQGTGDTPPEEKRKYNVLFIAVDDLNDWVGFLGGHPQTQTPNMDKLAREGVVFEKAYCPVSVSNASRAALLTGYRASSTGIYGNDSFLRDSKVLEKAKTLPQWLSDYGYFCMARGKIFHTPGGPWSDPQSWNLQVPTEGRYGHVERKPGLMANGIPVGEVDSNFDWGPTDAAFEETPDYLNAKWAAEQLAIDHDRPFFLACGIFRPHLNWYVPGEFFDKFREDEMILPTVNEEDYNDIPEGGYQPARDYYTIRKYGKEREVVQAYLACINYADSCIGVVLDALEKSKYADNTIVILWGDHGWHLGEKLRYKKVTLWEEACRMPLIIKVPGLSSNGMHCQAVVNLLDLYPTLTQLCSVPHNTANEGRSLVPLLKNVEKRWNYPTVTTMGQNRHAVRSDSWRYIRYQDGSEELYDHRTDTLEWTNLANDPKYDRIKRRLAKHIPQLNVDKVPGKGIGDTSGAD